MRPSALLLVSVLGTAGTAMAAATTWNINVGGTMRNAIVYAPSGMSKPPIVIQCHGLNQDAAYQQAQAKWEPIADTAKFLVVFPNGLNKSWDLGGTKDMDFMKAIIDTMAKKYGADRDRVYLSGFSMGGMFTYMAMNALSDKIAAFAPCSGYPMGGMTPSSPRPVPILHIHGTTDDVVGYSGVESNLAKWRTWNACPTTKTTIKPYPANKTGSVSARDTWGPCTKNGRTVEVSLITNTGKGHWYSMDASSALSSVEIWNFSKKYSLSSSTGIDVSAPGAIAFQARFEYGAIRVEGSADMGAVKVRDVGGRVLASWTRGLHATGAIVLPVGNAARGVYLVEATGPEGRSIRRLAIP